MPVYGRPWRRGPPGDPFVKTFAGIQYLRAIAAIGVVLFHAANRTEQGFAVGALGVDIFFVISGFIMWTVAARKQHHAAGFLLDRLRRIAPTYWIASAVMVLGALAGLFPRLTLGLPHVAASFAFLPAVSPANGHVWPVLVQGWTLNIEMLFYLIFAALLGLGRTPRLIALCAVLAGLVAIGAAIGGDHPILAFYATPRLLEFAAGAAIGEALLRGYMPGARTGLVLVIAGVAGFAAIHFALLPFAFVPEALSALTLVLGVAALDRADRMPSWPVLGFLGNASYAIYLWHTFAVGPVLKLSRMAALPPAPTVAMAALAGILLGCLLYVGLEQPLTRRLARRADARPANIPTA